MNEPQLDINQPSQPLHYGKLTVSQQRQRLWEIIRVFLKLGSIAFGGPAAHIAMMDDEVVKRRGWLSRERLLDLLGVTNLIPGPNSTELAIHLGYERAGWLGLLLAGISFILPAMLVVWGLAIAYGRYGSMPQVSWLLYGIQPVIIAIVIQALWALGRKAIKDMPTGMVALATMLAFAKGASEIGLLVIAGLSTMLIKHRLSGTRLLSWVMPSLLLTVPTPTPLVSWPQLFLFCLKVGSVLYGSGYVLLAFLQRDLVEHSHWLTSQQLLDAITIGQITPGPVFTTATFVGYLLAGHAGAIAATVGIFLPSFIFVLAVNPWVNKLRASPWANGFLDGVNAASLALMAVATVTLGKTVLVDGLTIAVALSSGIMLLKFQFNTLWLIAVGGILGLVAKLLF
jgi:chromate transporter